jgi:hypothetical protein
MGRQDRDHRIWVKNGAAGLDLSRWSRVPSTFSNMNELAELIYPTIESALDEAYEARRAAETDTISAPKPVAVPGSRVADLARELNRILDAVDREGRQQNESVVDRIRRLGRDNKIPRQVAALMCAIREYRNVGEHEGGVFSDADVNAVRGAWNVVHE